MAVAVASFAFALVELGVGLSVVALGLGAVQRLLRVALDTPVRGVAPGQTLVLYDGDRVLAAARAVLAARGLELGDRLELATEADGWSVHVDVRGLAPARDYFYRFLVGPHASTVGRTRTAPAAGAPLASLSFAWASCQKWEDGFYGAYADLARSAPDVVFFLGDYIYEYGIERKGARASLPRRPTTRGAS